MKPLMNKLLTGWTLFWLYSVMGTIQAAEPHLERLFYSPEQRIQIEQARNAYLKSLKESSQPKTTPQHHRTVTKKKPKVTAIIIGPDGRTHGRVNGRYQPLSNDQEQLDAQGEVTILISKEK